MNKFSQKGILLFAGAMAVCAFVLPSVASASSWGGTAHTVLDSPNLGFTSTISAPTTTVCTQSSFTARVLSAADMQITAGSFGGGRCTFISPLGAGTCTMTTTSTFPWTATAVTTSSIQIHNINIDIRFEDRPGSAVDECRAPFDGQTSVITGTLTGGSWTGNVVRAMDFNNAEGLAWHWLSPLGSSAPITIRGLLGDTNGLTVT